MISIALVARSLLPCVLQLCAKRPRHCRMIRSRQTHVGMYVCVCEVCVRAEARMRVPRTCVLAHLGSREQASDSNTCSRARAKRAEKHVMRHVKSSEIIHVDQHASTQHVEEDANKTQPRLARNVNCTCTQAHGTARAEQAIDSDSDSNHLQRKVPQPHARPPGRMCLHSSGLRHDEIEPPIGELLDALKVCPQDSLSAAARDVSGAPSLPFAMLQECTE